MQIAPLFRETRRAGGRGSPGGSLWSWVGPAATVVSPEQSNSACLERGLQMPRRSLCALLVTCLPGCSYLFVSGPPPDHKRLNYFDCTESTAAPVIDTVVFALEGLGTASVIVYQEGDRKVVGVIGGLVSMVLFGTSALYGYSKTDKCEKAQIARISRLDRREEKQRERVERILDRDLAPERQPKRQKPTRGKPSISSLWMVTPDGAAAYCPSADETVRSESGVRCVWHCTDFHGQPRRRVVLELTRSPEWAIGSQTITAGQCPPSASQAPEAE